MPVVMPKISMSTTRNAHTHVVPRHGPCYSSPPSSPPMNAPLFLLQCSRLPAEKLFVCTGLGTCTVILLHKRNKLTLLNVTDTYTYAYGENTSQIRLPRANVLGNYTTS